MKQKTKTWIAALTLSLISICSCAQEHQPTRIPRWVSEKGYWVVESNINTPLDHIIWFYDNDNVLIHKETVSGIRLNVKKTKVKMKLKKALESAITAWEKNKTQEVNKNHISVLLK